MDIQRSARLQPSARPSGRRLRWRFPKRLIISAAMAAVVALVSPMSLLAQEKLQKAGGSKAAMSSDAPVIVVTLGSINKLVTDINYVSSAVGQPQAGGMVGAMAAMFGQGLNLNEPIGVVVPLVNGELEPILLIPTADIRTTLKLVEAQIGPADELDDGTLVVSVGANTAYIRQNGDWAAAARKKDVLNLTPASPTELFVGMGNDYDLAVRVSAQQVPQDVRQGFMDSIRQGFDTAMEQQVKDDDKEVMAAAEGSLKQIERLLTDTDVLSFGFNVDTTNKQIVMDSSFSAVDGSELAAMYNGQKIPSQFASVIRDDAAAYYHAAMSIPPEAIKQAQETVKMVMNALPAALEETDELSETERADVTALVERLADLALDSIKEGKLDAGALLMADEEKLQFAMGSFVADGNEAMKIAKEIAQKVEGRGDAPQFKFDLANYKGVTMHMVEAEINDSEVEVKKVFGDTIRLHIGTGPKAIFVAFGNGSDELMKKLIDGTAAPQTSRLAAQMQVKLAPILKFIQSVGPNPVIPAMLDELAQGQDEGVISGVQDYIKNGADGQFTISEGVLRAIGAAARQAQQRRLNGQF